MIKTILLFILIIVIAWLSQDYFSITLPKNPNENNISTMKPKSIQTHTNGRKINTPVTITDKKVLDKLTSLLNENKFYDALTYYLEHNTLINRKRIESYLATLAKSNPTVALEYMQIFLDNEPQSNIAKLIIKTYIEQEDYARAIAMIMQMKENYVSEEEDTKLSVQLKETALKHIDTLVKRKEYASLISFLEEMGSYDSTDNFYTFRLAQLYMELDKTNEASALLETLKYDEVYAQNVKSLIDEIDKEEEEEYKYAIPLQKLGDHYVVNIFLNGTAFNLLLDTGATLILIDEDKASMLEVLRDDLTLQTAGNDIQAKLCNAETMRMGNLELANLKVTLADFKRDGIDGLLGMNFFKQFTFFINQDENVLYLNPK